MKIFKENRVKKIVRSCIYLLGITALILPTIDHFFHTEKSLNRIIFGYCIACITIILQTRKLTLYFDDSGQALKVVNSHVLGGGSETTIMYRELKIKLQNSESPKKLILNTDDVIIYKNDDKVFEIPYLDYVSDSIEFEKTLASFG